MKPIALVALLLAVSLAGTLPASPARAQATELFDFDSAPIHASLPLDLAVNGLTAHFTGGYSIQPANTLGFTPVGFAGLCLYPNSVFASDLGISFSEMLTDFSVLYAVSELACDSSAYMRVTAYTNGTFAGTEFTTATPGTYPTATLAISVPTGFNSVVVHWDHMPPGCSDYGPIFLADNVTATRMAQVGVEGGPGPRVRLLAPAPSPFRVQTALRFELRAEGDVRLSIVDLSGRLVRTLLRGTLPAGAHGATWDGTDDAGRRVPAGLYHVRIDAAGSHAVRKLLFVE